MLELCRHTIAGQDEAIIRPRLEVLNGVAIAFVGDVNIGNGPEGHGSVAGRWDYPSSFGWAVARAVAK